MRHVRQFSRSGLWLAGATALWSVAVPGCHGEVGAVGEESKVGQLCKGTSDPALVIAQQRFIQLTKPEILNTVGALISPEAATALATDPSFSAVPAERDLRFPPLSNINESVGITGDADSLPLISDMLAAASKYVFDHFTAVTGCATPATDSCATTWLKNTFSAKAYRRALSTNEQTRVQGLFDLSKSQLVNGWQITGTTEEATQNTVYGILMSPQMLWRSEIGDTSKVSSSPPGVPLTDDELATALSYYLTDAPPDDELRAAATGKQLAGNPGNLAAQVNRILGTPAAKTWLTQIMFTYYQFSRIYEASPDPGKFPVVMSFPNLLVDMHNEAQQFLNYTLWNGNLTDILLSRTAFVNTTLANQIYKVPVPAGATDTNFVQTTLPQDQRSGIITSAPYITLRAGADRESVVKRALLIKDTLLCLTTSAPPANIADAVSAARANFESQTEQEQVATRKAVPLCTSCHGNFDSYGLVLDGYDNLGAVRTTEPVKDATSGNIVQVPVDPSATLPPTLGGGPVANAVELSQALAGSEMFLYCQARTALQLAMADVNTAYVEMPTPPDITPAANGCAAIDVGKRYKSASGKTFADLLRAVAASPTFTLRAANP